MARFRQETSVARGEGDYVQAADEPRLAWRPGEGGDEAADTTYENALRVDMNYPRTSIAHNEVLRTPGGVEYEYEAENNADNRGQGDYAQTAGEPRLAWRPRESRDGTRQDEILSTRGQEEENFDYDVTMLLQDIGWWLNIYRRIAKGEQRQSGIQSAMDTAQIFVRIGHRECQ